MKIFAIAMLWALVAYVIAMFVRISTRGNIYHCTRCGLVYKPGEDERPACKRGPCPMELETD